MLIYFFPSLFPDLANTDWERDNNLFCALKR